jgi:hypothetical protein
MIRTSHTTPSDPPPTAIDPQVGVSEELAREARTWTPRPPEPVVEQKPEPRDTPKAVRYRWD